MEDWMEHGRQLDPNALSRVHNIENMVIIIIKKVMEGDVWVTPNFTSSHAIPRLGDAASNGHGGFVPLPFRGAASNGHGGFVPLPFLSCFSVKVSPSFCPPGERAVEHTQPTLLQSQQNRRAL
jgi:hypothetical protein